MTFSRFVIAAASAATLVAASPSPAAAQRRGAPGRAASGPVVGHAVPRTRIGPRGIVPRGVAPYRPYFYGPRYSLGFYYGYPYGYYGYPYSYGYAPFYGYAPYGYPGYGYALPPAGYYAPVAGRAYGGVRIVDGPPDAEVYADGYYVGIVDDFDGVFQHLNLTAGPHHIEIRAPGWPASVAFDVNVPPGQTLSLHVPRP